MGALGHGMKREYAIRVCPYGFPLKSDYNINIATRRTSMARRFPLAPAQVQAYADSNGLPPQAARGGARAGAGRKPLDAEGTIVQTVRLTAQQKATFDMLGGVQWLRGQLDLFAGEV